VVAAHNRNDDRLVDAADYVIWRKHLGTMAAATSVAETAVPEPSSYILAVVAALLGRRRQYGRRQLPTRKLDS
jgi:hypothetical protein